MHLKKEIVKVKSGTHKLYPTDYFKHFIVLFLIFLLCFTTEERTHLITKLFCFFNLFYSLLHSQASIKDGFSLENKYTQIL